VTAKTAHVVIDGPGYASVAVELPEGITTLGRLPANDVVLDDPQVSRHHARISFFEREATFQDLDSHNGSLVNDRRVTTCLLTPDDVVRIGPFRLRYRAGSAEGSKDALVTPRSASHLETTRRPAGSNLASLLLRAIDNTVVAPPKEALARTLAAVDQAFHADRSALVRRAGDGRLTFVHGREEGQTNDLPGVSSEIVEWVVQRRFPVSSENPSADPRFHATESSRPAACVPIGREATIWGAIYVERSTPSFSLSDLDALQAVAHLLQTFLETERMRAAPWRLEAEPTGAPRALEAMVVAIEFTPSLGDPADTVSDDPDDEHWAPGVLSHVVEAARRGRGWWIGHDDRCVLLAFPLSNAERGELELVRSLSPLSGRAVRLRMGLASGRLVLRDVPLPGSPRIFGSGSPVRNAARHAASADWGTLAAPAELASRLSGAGLKPAEAPDGTVRIALESAAHAG